MPFVELALALAIFVLTPLTLFCVVRSEASARLARILKAAYAAGALSALVSFAVEPGALAAALGCGWLALTVIALGHGLARAVSRSTMRLEESCIDVGLVYLAVGGAWFVIWRSGAGFGGFEAHTALLTAVHFHYAGFVSLILCGLAARELRTGDQRMWRRFRVPAIVVIAGPAVVAIGIVSSHVLETVAAVGLALGISSFAVAVLVRVARSPRRRAAKLLLRASAIAAIAAMALAVSYATTGLLGLATPSIEGMERTHGVLNALGYALCGVVAWLIEPPRRSVPDGRPPFSSLASGLRVGADFFERRALTSPDTHVRGLVDDLRDYDSPEFDAAIVAPAVRAFYEDTGAFDLRLFPRWRGVSRRFARGYAGLSARLEQVHYEAAQSDGAGIESRVVALDPSADGRSGVRGWVRWYRDSGRAIYVAAYATHRDRLRAYMNIAFPLPGGNLASILRPGNHGAGGISLTSWAAPDQPGHEGVYFASTLVPIRLPINETIFVWSVDDVGAPRDLVFHRLPTTVAVARHDAWLLGAHILTLDYAIDRAPTPRLAATND